MAHNTVFKFVSVRPPQRVDESTARTLFPRFDGGRRTPLHEAVAELSGDDARPRAAAFGLEFLASERYVAHPEAREETLGLVRAIGAALAPGDEPPEAARMRDAVEAVVGEPLRQFVGGERFTRLKSRFWDSLYAHVLVGEASSDLDDITAGIRVLHLLEQLAAARDGVPLTWAAAGTLPPVVPEDLLPPPARRGGRPGTDAKAGNPTDGAGDRDDQPPEQPVLAAARRLGRAIAAVEATGGHVGAADSSGATVARRREFDPETAALLAEFGIDPEVAARGDVLASLRRVTGGLWASLEHAAVPAPGGVGPGPATAHAVRADARYVPAAGGWSLPEGYAGVLSEARQPGDNPKPYRVLGIGDLQVVRETLLRYEAGEVAHIENVLQSERRERVHKRELETEQTITLETERVEERERDLQTTERFELQRETQRTISSDTSVQAGATVSGKYGYVDVTASGNFAHETSRSESNRNASTYARDVTERAVERLTERVREERVRRTLERITETNTHGFDNTDGAGHVRGVYQWVDKVYQAQVVNYGQRLMLEFVVPEPAAFFLFTQRNPALDGDSPVRPLEPLVPLLTAGGDRYLRDASGNIVFQPLAPQHLDPSVPDFPFADYRYWVTRYAVPDAAPPPPVTTFVATSLAKERQAPGRRQADELWSAQDKDGLEVPPGYRAVAGWLQGSAVQPLNASSQNAIAIAGRLLQGNDAKGEVSFQIPEDATGIDGTIPLTVRTNHPFYTLNVVIRCERTPRLLEQWQLETFAAIMAAYGARRQEYDQAQSRVQRADEIAGRNPARSRQIVRDELKKHCITLLGGERYEQFDAVRTDPNSGYPEIDVEEAKGEGGVIQFLEQAFEWGQMTYLFYPYFWGRKEHWRTIFPLDDVDAALGEFLRAGAARVIVPVHPAYNGAVALFVATDGEALFGGGDAPTLGSDLFVSIAAELRRRHGVDFEQGPGVIDVVRGERRIVGHGTAFDPLRDVDRELEVGEGVYRIQRVIGPGEIVVTEPYAGESRGAVPYGLGPRLVGLPWEVRVPTTLVYLNGDSRLPDWTAARRR